MLIMFSLFLKGVDLLHQWERKWVRGKKETQGEEFLCPWNEDNDEEEDKEQEGSNCVGLLFPFVWL